MLCTEDLVRDCVLVQLRVREAVLDAVLEGGAPGCEAVLAGCEARVGVHASASPPWASDEA